jgi:transcription-repair coupling factor (superfamily II helicase)
MQLTGLLNVFRGSRAYQAFLEQLHQPHSQHTIVRSARPFLLAALAHDWHSPIVYLTARGRRAYNVTEQLVVWLDEQRQVYRFAEPTPAFYDRIAWDRAIIRERLQVLSAFMSPLEPNNAPIVISSARALMQRTLSPQSLRENSIELTPRTRFAPEKLARRLVEIGYESVPMCIEPSTFRWRAGIVDVYPINANAPIRLEYFDDEIETLKHFDPSTQRSTHKLERVLIPPAREVLPSLMPALANVLNASFSNMVDEDGEQLNLQQDLSAIESGQAFNYLEHYLPYVSSEFVSLLEHLPQNTLILLEDAEEIEQRIEELAKTARSNFDNNLATHQIAADHPVPFVDWGTLNARLSLRHVLHLTNNPTNNSLRLFSPAHRYSGQLRSVLNDAQGIMNDNGRVVIVSAQIDRLIALWAEITSTEFTPKLTDIEKLSAGISFVSGELSEGWQLELQEGNVLLLSDAEIFSWQRPEPRRRKNQSGKRQALPESDYIDWKINEYVVHADYGIGQFRGLIASEKEGNQREYLVVVYASNDMLFVPIDQADRLTRYAGADDMSPTLNNIGRPQEWQKAKDKARKAAEEEAQELLAIYAKRASTHGYRFRPDTAYQTEMEANFPYVETEDQLRVIKEIKTDMEKDTPMDRLVTGDVGYGKTEVALRAAFKAVMDGKQVAVLVPTTVLADQHYHTFSRRMEGFGVEVALMSRFRTKQEQDESIKRMADGKIDVVIGTHRLLSDDIALPNLGLVIVDEEQRFGVKHKEHFKKFRSNIDMLTLTATPIPRTLYMSISGVRDISIIQTPPEERLPVVTHVGVFSNKLVRQSILRELDRGGQVFVIHNRVKTIENLKDRLENLVPEASIIVGHGQMSGRQLENVISEFGRGHYDILLATSIIENGIDMPNVNTLIVDHAEWFGLSQLYQIRGRVGRGAQQAYAYFFHAKGSQTTEARERLDTLAEYSDLGVGLQIATRDLEIRGAGDILSMRQSGHITTVGLELYTQLLQQAVRRLKKEELGEIVTDSSPAIDRESVVIDLPIAAYLPEIWIPEMAIRLQLYRRIGNLQSLAEIDALREELRDRFGELPKAVEGLLYQIHIKLLANSINASAIVKPREHILIRMGWLQAIDRDRLARLLGKDVEVSRTAVEFKPIPETWRTRLLTLMQNLETLMPKQQKGV